MSRRIRRRLSIRATDNRDLIVFKTNINWTPETHTPYMRIKYYDFVSRSDMQSLLAGGFKITLQDPECMPSIGGLLEFLDTYSHYHFHGYVIGPYCSDTRVCIEGIEYKGDHPPTEHELDDFRKLFNDASELTIEGNTLKAWYD